MPDIEDDDTTIYECVSCHATTEDEYDYVWLDEFDGLTCSDCFFICGHCETACSNNDSYYIEGRGDWCSDCYNNSGFYCSNCENNYYERDINIVRITDTGDCYCYECASDNFNNCDECGDYYETECGECDFSPRLINSYQYKPDPTFYGMDKHGLYLGLELESEIRSNKINESALLFKDNVPEVYLKQDSSINSGGYNGYEIVSHPLSFSYWQNNMSHLFEAVDTIREDYQARSWDSDSCGIHIHLSRKGFKSGAHMHRWINFIYKNVEPLTKYAGRKPNRYAQWNDVWKFDEYGRPTFSLKNKILGGQFTERYSAVNTQNEHTLELRIFRGTTKPEGILATLEFAHASVEYTRDMTLSDVKLGMLKWEWFCDYVQANNGLYPNLYDRLEKAKYINLNNRQELIEA